MIERAGRLDFSTFSPTLLATRWARPEPGPKDEVVGRIPVRKENYQARPGMIIWPRLMNPFSTDISLPRVLGLAHQPPGFIPWRKDADLQEARLAVTTGAFTKTKTSP